MYSTIRTALVVLLAFTLLTGVAYPLAVTGIAHVAFQHQANGSPILRDGKVVGSALVGQAFTADRYFHGRPSAAGETGYDASASSGSNLGPLSAKLRERIVSDVAKLRADGAGAIPADAVTTSGSGLDPNISPAFAALQIGRVAKARGVTIANVSAIVEAQTVQPTFGIVGQPRLNVLRLNIALDAALGPASG